MNWFFEADSIFYLSALSWHERYALAEPCFSQLFTDLNKIVNKQHLLCARHQRVTIW